MAVVAKHPSQVLSCVGGAVVFLCVKIDGMEKKMGKGLRELDKKMVDEFHDLKLLVHSLPGAPMPRPREPTVSDSDSDS